MPRPLIAITMGDPAGIGPEICLRLLADRSTRERCVPVVFGDGNVLQRAARECRLPPPDHVIDLSDWNAACGELVEPTVLDVAAMDDEQLVPGVVSRETGAAAYRYIDLAIAAAMDGEVDAVTTGPIQKEAWQWAGIEYPGHTELFAERAGAARVCMMMTSSELTCSLVTTHVGYRDVTSLLSIDRVLDVIELSAEAMSRMRGRPARLVVCGLNPHAGENGLFGGREEQTIITPAIDAARAKGIDVEGPVPPDTAFLPTRRRSTDCFICMYHDQGLIPLKALAFDSAVNVTLGLPIVRTSVDHGTALDVAWQGSADATSLIQATSLAVQLSAGRRRSLVEAR